MAEKFEYNVKPSEVPLGTTGLDVPFIYADDIRGSMVAPGVTKLNLIEYRFNAQTNELFGVHRAVIGVPTLQLRGWARYLTNLANDAGLPELEEEPPADAQP